MRTVPGFPRLFAKTTTVIAILLGMLLLLFAPIQLMAKSFPQKTIKMIVPYRAGGGTDTMARVLAKALKEELGKPIIVVNRKGGGGSVGASFLKKSSADGHTIMMGGDDITTWNPKVQNVDFKPQDFVYLAGVAEYQNALITTSDKPYQSLNDMIEYSKANPGLRYASMFPLEKFVIEKFISKNNLDWKIISVTGGAETAQLLLGGKIDIAYSGGIHTRYEGKLSVLASMNKERLPGAPDKVSLHEMYGLSIPSYIILMAPAGIPDDVAQTLEKAILKASESHDFKTIVEERMKAPVIRITGAELATHIRALDKNLQP